MGTAAKPASESTPFTYGVDPRVGELFAEHGFARTDREGNTLRDKDKVVARIADVLIHEALADDVDERVERAISKPVLYERLFPQGPALDDPSDEECELAESVATYVWSMTTPSYDGSVQRILGDRPGGADLMLCRRKIGGVPSIYVTRTDELIVDDFLMPAAARVVKVADKTRHDMDLLVKRRPSLEARVRRELTTMAMKTSVALGVTNGAAALESGS